MARGTAEANGTTADAPHGLKADGTPRKRAVNTGPRKTKPVHVAVEVQDESGNTIPNARLHVHKVSKDFESVFEHLEHNPSHVRLRIPLDSIAD